jgi:hypothetical protein
MEGSWCPYACKSPFIEAQYDNEIGQPWAWSISCAGRNQMIGAGRRIQMCPGANVPEPPICAGGQQGISPYPFLVCLSFASDSCVTGLYCNAQHQAVILAPSSLPPLAYQTNCIPTVNAVEIVNDTPWTITACRTVFPGSEVPQIPTEFPPGSTIQLPTPFVETPGVKKNILFSFFVLTTVQTK